MRMQNLLKRTMAGGSLEEPCDVWFRDASEGRDSMYS